MAGKADTPLTPEEMDAYGKVYHHLAAKESIDCTGCGFCPCQYGIVIRDSFKIYNCYHAFEVLFISDKTWGFILANNGMEADKCGVAGERVPED